MANQVIDVNFNDKDKLGRLFQEDAEKQALEFPEKKSHGNLTKSQIRRFFGEVKSLQLKYRRHRDWSKIEPPFRMLVAKARYARSRRNIPEVFEEFIEKNNKKVTNGDEFERFSTYFEAVLAYSYGLDRISNN